MMFLGLFGWLKYEPQPQFMACMYVTSVTDFQQGFHMVDGFRFGYHEVDGFCFDIQTS